MLWPTAYLLLGGLGRGPLPPTAVSYGRRTECLSAVPTALMNFQTGVLSSCKVSESRPVGDWE